MSKNGKNTEYNRKLVLIYLIWSTYSGYGVRRSKAFERCSEPGVRFGRGAEREHERPERFGRSAFEPGSRTEP